MSNRSLICYQGVDLGPTRQILKGVTSALDSFVIFQDKTRADLTLFIKPYNIMIIMRLDRKMVKKKESIYREMAYY